MTEKRNRNLMSLIRRAHGLVENPDLEKQRQSQDTLGSILSNSKDITYRETEISGLYAEWVSVNRAHLKKYVILHCHGGGYSTGSSLYARTLTSKLAAAASMDVLSFDYRLAPEHPFPAATEDVMKVWDYLMLQGYGAKDIIVTGDSAGGNLALALTLRLKGEDRILPRALVLMSPWTDLTCSGESYQDKAELDPVLNKAYIDRMIQSYAANRNLKDPFISPIYGDFKDFPSVYIQVGENEILYSDSLMLYQALKEAGVAVKMDEYPGMWHVFQMSPVKASKEAVNKIADYIYDICR
ncbi:MAG: alpha/beta hydrolase [Acetatifactor sp.]